jgi:hypothetical protein
MCKRAARKEFRPRKHQETVAVDFGRTDRAQRLRRVPAYASATQKGTG